MGIFRLLLALAVVFSHTSPIGGWTLTGGDASVESFFMVSGFYIYMVLNGKYATPGGAKVFFFNRFLRLYPAYWIALLFTLLTPLWGMKPGEMGSPLYAWAHWLPSMSWSTIAAASFANLGIFFLDALHFLRFDAVQGSLHWFGDGWWAWDGAWRLLLIPQSWSLGIEVAFYLVAPLILRRGPGLVAAIAGASLLLRFFLYRGGLNLDPWTVRFFPNELAFFCVGALACHFYQTRLADVAVRPWVPKAVMGVVLAATLGFQFVPVFHYWTNAWAFYALVAVSLPFLFKATARSKLDRALGELSYPVYICHYTWIRLIAEPSGAMSVEQKLTVLFFTLLSAYLILQLTRPIEARRAANARKLVRQPPAFWQPTLAGKLIRLRPLAENDFEPLHAAASDPLIWEQHPEPERHLRENFARYFRQGIESKGALAILDQATGQLIGSSRFSLHNPSLSCVEVGYTFLSRPYWGKGHNRELKSLMLGYAFQHVENVLFYVGEMNHRSRKAMSGIGAAEVGKVPSQAGSYTAVIYQMKKSDWAR